MSLTVIPVTTGQPTTGYSTPTRVSFCVEDDGNGGQTLINGLGVTSASVASAVDLATLFGSPAFRSISLLRAFRITASQQAACDQFNSLLDIQINPEGSAGLPIPALIALHGVGGGPANAPYLAIGGPAAAGIWRVDLVLRNSIRG